MCFGLVACGGGSAHTPTATPPAASETNDCVAEGGGHMPTFGPAELGSTQDARRVATFAMAASVVGSTADALATALIDPCAQIGQAAGLTEAELAAGVTEDLAGVRTVCQRAGERAHRELEALRSAGATVTARAGDSLDQMSLGGYGECLHSCDPAFHSSPETVACDGVARGECTGNCEGRCISYLETAAACDGECSGTCAGTCTPTTEPNQCQGRCAGQCEGQCISESHAACTGECTGNCAGAWRSDVACRGTGRPTAPADASCRASCDAFHAIYRDHPDGEPGSLTIQGAPAASAERVAAMTQAITDNLTRLGYLRATLRLQIAATATLLETNAGLTRAAASLGERAQRCERQTREQATRSRAQREQLLVIVEAMLTALGATG